MSDIPPALTPKEWAQCLQWTGTNVEDLLPHGLVLGSPAHALAALCLHDQPFGFTREDLDNERAEYIALTDMKCWYELGLLTFGKEQKIARLEALLAAKVERIHRIEALLPPEGGES